MTSDETHTSIFECCRCGDCCKGYGGTYVSEEDIRRIAAHIEVEITDFKARYCQMSGDRPVLSQAENGYCVFWDELCTIHPVKPRMCRRWPYIEAVLTDHQNWKSMGASCPGIRRDAPEDIVQEQVAREIDKDASG